MVYMDGKSCGSFDFTQEKKLVAQVHKSVVCGIQIEIFMILAFLFLYNVSFKYRWAHTASLGSRFEFGADVHQNVGIFQPTI